MSKAAMANWFSRSAGSLKTIPKESSTLVKFSTVHPSPEESKENLQALGNTNHNEIGNAIKACEKSQLPADHVVSYDFGKVKEEEEEEEDLELDEAANDEFLQQLELGPQLPLKEQLEKDKDDESLRRWKEQLLGSTASCPGSGDGLLEPEVNVLRLGILTKGREELELLLPLTSISNTRLGGHTFFLKEGCRYQLKFVFTVRNNIVSGLTCINNVWKAGFLVDHTRSMLGTFSPQQEPYMHIMPERVTPSGLLARGSYTARKRFVDDDGTVYLDFNYSFEIRKDW